MNKKICVIGGGYWGSNHIRTLHELGNLGAVVESNPDTGRAIHKEYAVPVFSDVDAALTEGFDGYVISTPASTHFAIGKQLLEKGNHVLIEKPMALSAEESGKLLRIADASGSNLMVGHVLLFHPAIRKIKEIIDDGVIGKLQYVYSNRLNLGKVRTEEHVFWSFAPHDISILDYLVGSPSLKVEAKGSKFLQDKVFDVTMAQFEYPDNVQAHIFVSWLHPYKEQRLVVVGSKGMLSFEDSSKEKNIYYYNKKIDWTNGVPTKMEKPEEIIPYERAMPLTEELKYFIENLDRGFDVASGQAGHEVVKILETVEKQITGEQ